MFKLNFMAEKIKILLIDDDVDIRSMYAEIFKQENFEVIEAEDGVEGLDKATKETPNIIFTGIIMPRMDGFGLKEALAKNVSTASIPVIMLSHMGREEDRKKAFEIGVSDFVVQGMATPRQIVEKIKKMFSPTGYRLRFNPNDLDAPKLASDSNLNSRFECPKCSGEMILKLDQFDVSRKEFKAKLSCLKCGEV